MKTVFEGLKALKVIVSDMNEEPTGSNLTQGCFQAAIQSGNGHVGGLLLECPHDSKKRQSLCVVPAAMTMARSVASANLKGANPQSRGRGAVQYGGKMNEQP